MEETRWAMAGTLWVVLLIVSSANGFYLPGVAPRDFQIIQHLLVFFYLYMQGETLEVKVNKLTSSKTQLPYDYYFLDYCTPPKIKNRAENLGEVLRGDRIESSVYSFRMREPQSCKIACRVKLTEASAKNFKKKIKDDYQVNMILDNLPVAVVWERTDGSKQHVYERGFRVGYTGIHFQGKDKRYYINNHLNFKVKYHPDPDTGTTARVVGFEVFPLSINHQYKKWDGNRTKLSTCKPSSATVFHPSIVPQEFDADKEIVFTYDVSFEASDIRWASRWDTYLLMDDSQIHWFSIVNSLMIVLFLSGMVAVIMLRTLYRDIVNYNQLEQDEMQDETGWKLVHGDVFRPPTNCSLLCVYVGTGIQVFGMAFVTMIFAMLGFLSPSNRGGLMTAMVFLWVFMGLFAGFASGYLFKRLNGIDWKKTVLKTAIMFPGILFAVFFILNAMIWGEKSSGAVPFGTMFALVLLWFGISLPLVFVGGFLGFKAPASENPVKTNKIPRPIPLQPWYMQPSIAMLFGGVLPFGAVFVELFFILTSVWLNQFYYIFGFLFLVFIILLVTCAEVTIVMCYFQLCNEDYRWWWRSYLTSGASALYLFLYSMFYFFTKLEITMFVSGILYFSYMAIIAYTFFILTGAIGFCACLCFVHQIYASLKID